MIEFSRYGAANGNRKVSALTKRMQKLKMRKKGILFFVFIVLHSGDNKTKTIPHHPYHHSHTRPRQSIRKKLGTTFVMDQSFIRQPSWPCVWQVCGRDPKPSFLCSSSP